MDRVTVFDTTLRDGEQSPGATMTPSARLRIAQMLAEAKVDVIEAGFPAASPIVVHSVAEIARAVKGAGVSVAALARTTPGDIDAAWEALQHADAPRIHTFLATSNLHLEHKLRISPDDAIEAVTDGVKRAKRYCPDVEFSAEDATRSDWDFLVRIFSAAAKAGATTLNVPDTVGYTTPAEYAELITYLRERVTGADKVVFSVHTHDDLGLAVANALSAVAAGARQVECTINGIGERAGNCSLEEVVVGMRVRADAHRVCTNFDQSKIQKISQTVARATRMPVQKNKAIVGTHAFMHESGIHQDGILKHKGTYEIIDPKSVGVEQTRFSLSRNSGKHAILSRIRDIGFVLDRAAEKRFLEAFAALAQTRRTVGDGELVKLAQDATGASLIRPPGRLEVIPASGDHQAGREFASGAIMTSFT
ncbi:MAG: 2-isopropylmalate synthase [Candidatus Eremiobacteraeota bacterium]|nr:2-isopropylmalate synthase [Candidatus Eremiobacteraeota bacterium]